MEKTINVVYKKLDPEVKGLTKKNKDLSYTVVLNSMYCAEALEKTYKHEVSHIMEEHHNNGLYTVEEIEKEARRNNDTIPLFTEDQGQLLMMWVLGSKQERLEIEKNLDRISTKMPPLLGSIE